MPGSASADALFRIETDSLGEVRVPTDKLGGGDPALA
jgi:hypothetical protein